MQHLTHTATSAILELVNTYPQLSLDGRLRYVITGSAATYLLGQSLFFQRMYLDRERMFIEAGAPLFIPLATPRHPRDIDCLILDTDHSSEGETSLLQGLPVEIGDLPVDTLLAGPEATSYVCVTIDGQAIFIAHPLQILVSTVQSWFKNHIFWSSEKRASFSDDLLNLTSALCQTPEDFDTFIQLLALRSLSMAEESPDYMFCDVRAPELTGFARYVFLRLYQHLQEHLIVEDVHPLLRDRIVTVASIMNRAPEDKTNDVLALMTQYADQINPVDADAMPLPAPLLKVVSRLMASPDDLDHSLELLHALLSQENLMTSRIQWMLAALCEHAETSAHVISTMQTILDDVATSTEDEIFRALQARVRAAAPVI